MADTKHTTTNCPFSEWRGNMNAKIDQATKQIEIAHKRIGERDSRDEKQEDRLASLEQCTAKMEAFAVQGKETLREIKSSVLALSGKVDDIKSVVEHKADEEVVTTLRVKYGRIAATLGIIQTIITAMMVYLLTRIGLGGAANG